ncbi:hypothetical protein BpHYR1_052313 [Brachionus plicatilis]|uniref:Uncharacterized protein n=1 Tax=Brachionus plicatilis TaxID=10195 RepID=A0A3M7T3G1_BRAPC|nr:hypothetical protein BpHYR1_052313 [Brachionus plicatilis]
MFDVFHALGTLPTRRDRLKSSMISINEFLGPDAASFFNLFKAIINSFKQIASLKLDWSTCQWAFNSDLLTASFLEVSSYFPTFFDQINNVRWKTRFLVYCEGTFSDIHYLRI